MGVEAAEDVGQRTRTFPTHPGGHANAEFSNRLHSIMVRPTMKKVLILGATSAIAQATVRLLAARGASLYLVGRNATNLDAVARDATTRGASKVEQQALDLDDFSAHEALVERATQALGGLDGAVIAHGVLGDQKACERSWTEAEKVLRTNFLSAASLLTALANRFEAQKAGTLVVISSVAGDRARVHVDRRDGDRASEPEPALR